MCAGFMLVKEILSDNVWMILNASSTPILLLRLWKYNHIKSKNLQVYFNIFAIDVKIVMSQEKEVSSLQFQSVRDES